jgi:hypothetical protein
MYLGFHDHTAQLNIPGKILRVRHVQPRQEAGLAAGVTIWFRLPPRPDGRPGRDDQMHVPFDCELQLVETMAI